MRKKIEPIGTPPDKEGNVTGRYKLSPDFITIYIKGSSVLGAKFGFSYLNSFYLETMLRLHGGESKEIHDIKKFISREVESIWYNEKDELQILYFFQLPETEKDLLKEKELQAFFEKHCLSNTLFKKLLKHIKKGWVNIDRNSIEFKAFPDLARVEEFEKKERELQAKEKELKKLQDKQSIDRLHKQPRNLLKTVGQSISNTTEAPTLFTLPQKTDQGGAIGEVKEEISKNTGALAFYLIQKYQENNSKALEITNLSPISESLGCNNYRLKLYLLYLGGYVYPIVDRDEKTKELVLTNEQLFKIEFRYSKEIANKYLTNNKGEIQGVERIGNDLLSFIKDEPIDRVVITPSQRFITALEGKGLGNILTVNNKFVGLILELTDIATKILCYSSSNKPYHKIAEDNFIKHLGLSKQIKKQGRPRVRATILKGLQELQEKGHIKNYSYEEATSMYSYTYSDKYVKYKESKKEKKELIQGVQ